MNTFDVGLVTEIGLAGPGAFGFDELRIGNTWEDVTPVPEPATVVLASLGIVALLLRGKTRG